MKVGLSALLALALATAALAVSPAASGAQVVEEDRPGILFLIDTSGSMRGARIAEAKTAIGESVEVLADSFNLGLRNFAGTCTSFGSNLIEVGPVDDVASFRSTVNSLSAGGGTPTSAALRAAVDDLPGREGTIVLVADGDDQCGDLCATAQQLAAEGITVTLQAVGVQVGSAVAQEMECAANATGGQFVAITDLQDFTEVLVGISSGCAVDPVQCYAPRVIFDSDEDFFPMSADDFVRNSELRWAADSGCADTAVDQDPSPRKLTDGSYQANEKSNFICRSQDLFFSNSFTRVFGNDFANNGTERARGQDGDRLANNEGFYLNWTGDAAPTGDVVGEAPVYVEVLGDGSIEYWFFYGFDPKTNDFDGVVSHEGDWEHILVTPPHVDPAGVGSVTYFGHNCDGRVVSWDDVQFHDGTHPTVWVAEGAHASYPEPWDVGNPCGGILGIEGVSDRANGFGPRWNTWETNSLVIASTQCWYGFGGAWGDTSGRWGVRGNATGPAGLPYQSPNTEADTFVPSIEPCELFDGGIARSEPGIEVPSGWDRLQSWLNEVLIEFEQGIPGARYEVTIDSLPVQVAESVVAADGTVSFQFIIPPGTPEGEHRVRIRNQDTGEVVYSHDIWVQVPQECLGSSPDFDGDGVIDICDPNPLDGPNADFDGDGVSNDSDNCPTVVNADQISASNFREPGLACDFREGVNTAKNTQVLDYLSGPFCGFYVPTIMGTDGDDVIRGTQQADIIWAGGGDDRVFGFNGNDIICGGDGDDEVFGSAGDDVIFGGSGDDRLLGASGDDVIRGEQGSDDIVAAGGDDRIDGGAGIDSANGGGGRDVCANVSDRRSCASVDSIED